MTQMKKEAEVVKAPKTRAKASKEKTQIFMEDGDYESLELDSRKMKKIKPLVERFENLKQQQESFDAVEGDLSDKFKKFDFSSCKLLAKEYKTMIVGMYLNSLFKKHTKIQKEYAFETLRQYKDVNVYKALSEHQNILDNSLSSLFRANRQDMAYRLEILKGATSTLPAETSLKTFNIHDHNLFASIGKNLEKQFQANLEAELEVESILKSSSSLVGKFDPYPSDNLFAPSESYSVNEKNRQFLMDVEKRRIDSSSLMIEEDRKKKYQNISKLVASVSSQPIKNSQKLLSKIHLGEEKIPALEQLLINSDINLKKVELKSDITAPICSNRFNFITVPVEKEEGHKMIDEKETYIFSRTYMS